jgi:hypothetical protein
MIISISVLESLVSPTPTFGLGPPVEDVVVPSRVDGEGIARDLLAVGRAGGRARGIGGAGDRGDDAAKRSGQRRGRHALMRLDHEGLPGLAGSEPPVTLLVGEPSSLPNQTPVVRLAV